jgi:hypothetical protein
MNGASPRVGSVSFLFLINSSINFATPSSIGFCLRADGLFEIHFPVGLHPAAADAVVSYGLTNGVS